MHQAILVIFNRSKIAFKTEDKETKLNEQVFQQQWSELSWEHENKSHFKVSGMKSRENQIWLFSKQEKCKAFGEEETWKLNRFKFCTENFVHYWSELSSSKPQRRKKKVKLNRWSKIVGKRQNAKELMCTRFCNFSRSF